MSEIDHELPEKPVTGEPLLLAHNPEPPITATRSPNASLRWTQVLSVALIAILSSVLVNWALLAAGVFKVDATRTITQNSQKIVMQQGEVTADVFAKVDPSTVSITTEEPTITNSFFGTAAVQQGAGSGIIVSSDGYILTNKHVVPEGITSVTVITSQGKEYKNVSVVGRDPVNDIAFLKINGEKNLKPATLGDSSKVRPGQQVVAIGNALGQFHNSVTAGIISGLGRPIQASDGSGSSEKLENLLQTDAAINPGNSGGPLVNMQGEVIGIDTAMAEQAQAIGFAIPINDAKSLVATVLKQGKIVKSYLGVRYIGLDDQTARQLNIGLTQGAYVLGSDTQPAVMPGSPADKAGVREHDVITKVNGQDVTQDAMLGSLLAPFTPGDKVTLTIQRDGKTITVPVTLEAFPGS